MTPYDHGPRRRSYRRTLRGIPAGRRATHQPETTYGHRQRERDRRAAWLLATARAEMAAGLNYPEVTA